MPSGDESGEVGSQKGEEEAFPESTEEAQDSVEEEENGGGEEGEVGTPVSQHAPQMIHIPSPVGLPTAPAEVDLGNGRKELSVEEQVGMLKLLADHTGARLATESEDEMEVDMECAPDAPPKPEEPEVLEFDPGRPISPPRGTGCQRRRIRPERIQHFPHYEGEGFPRPRYDQQRPFLWRAEPSRCHAPYGVYGEAAQARKGHQTSAIDYCLTNWIRESEEAAEGQSGEAEVEVEVDWTCLNEWSDHLSRNASIGKYLELQGVKLLEEDEKVSQPSSVAGGRGCGWLHLPLSGAIERLTLLASTHPERTGNNNAHINLTIPEQVLRANLFLLHSITFQMEGLLAQRNSCTVPSSTKQQISTQDREAVAQSKPLYTPIPPPVSNTPTEHQVSALITPLDDEPIEERPLLTKKERRNREDRWTKRRGDSANNKWVGTLEKIEGVLGVIWGHPSFADALIEAFSRVQQEDGDSSDSDASEKPPLGVDDDPTRLTLTPSEGIELYVNTAQRFWEENRAKFEDGEMRAELKGPASEAPPTGRPPAAEPKEPAEPPPRASSPVRKRKEPATPRASSPSPRKSPRKTSPKKSPARKTSPKKAESAAMQAPPLVSSLDSIRVMDFGGSNSKSGGTGSQPASLTRTVRPSPAPKRGIKPPVGARDKCPLPGLNTNLPPPAPSLNLKRPDLPD